MLSPRSYLWYFFRPSPTMAAALIALLLLGGCQSGDSPQDTNRVPAEGKASDSITSLAFASASLSMGPGARQALTVYGTKKDGTRLDLSKLPGLQFAVEPPGTASVASGTAEVLAAETAKTGARATITVTYQGQTAELPLRIKPSLQDTVTVNSKGEAVITNTSDIALVVNKQRQLPENYAPSDLVEPSIPFSFKEKNEKKLMRKEAAQAVEKLFAQAKKENLSLTGVSAYRSYATQKSLFQYYVKTQGEQNARKYSAIPGTSEHQTGLAIDVSSPDVRYALDESFAGTKESKWLVLHAAEFGFIIRYPQGKEQLTGYAYEPWHIRYVGADIAAEVQQREITLEQYFEDAVAAGSAQ
ncbi:M15 family metallopeptidase [Paenibacillus sp. y28]|uniref:M15 family metallopeptidase n=1 Tax=Paenibacillus sp. y28 TaxID=3129110 RepID=UPI003016B600